MSTFDDRIKLQANGYDPVAVNGKKAILPNWSQLYGVSADQMRTWPGANTGILTRDTPAFDIDVRHPEAAEACAAAANDWRGESGLLLTRFGQPPKRAILHQTATPFKKIYRDFRHPNDKEGDKPHRLEFLGDGQQIVVLGTHPDTGKEYSWHGGSPLTVPRQDLPGTDEEDARRLLDHCSDILIQEYGFVEIAAGQVSGAGNGHDTQADGPFDPFVALQNMQPSDADAADKQPRIIMSLLRRGYHPDEVTEIVCKHTLEIANAAGLPWTNIGVMEAWHPPGRGPDTPERVAANALAEQVFIELLTRFIAQGRVASDSAGRNYAPSLFADEPEAAKAGLSKAALGAAMKRLFAANRLRVDTTTSHAHRIRCLVPV